MTGAVLVVPATIKIWPELGWVFGLWEKDPPHAGASGSSDTSSLLTLRQGRKPGGLNN